MKVKKHTLLNEISASLNGRLPSETVEVLGHRYTIRACKPEGEDWAAARTEGSTFAAALLNSRKPAIAVALVEIDDIPVEQLFQPDEELDAAVREQLLSDAKAIRDWRRDAILDWLKEELDPYVVDTIYTAYSKLSGKHKDAMRAMENLSKRTPLPA